jgi:hypothetical protein
MFEYFKTFYENQPVFRMQLQSMAKFNNQHREPIFRPVGVGGAIAP